MERRQLFCVFLDDRLACQEFSSRVDVVERAGYCFLPQINCRAEANASISNKECAIESRSSALTIILRPLVFLTQHR